MAICAYSAGVDMTQEALKLALEALSPIAHNTTDDPRNQAYKAITAIKEALAQPEPVALQDDEIYDAAFSAYCRGENSRELFRIMWNSRLTCSIGWDRDELKSFARNIAALYTTPPQPEQEPVKMVAYNCTCGRTMKFESVHGVVAPQRTWVGLASEDRLTAKYMQDAPDGIEAVIDYIEAKLKEKNCAG